MHRQTSISNSHGVSGTSGYDRTLVISDIPSHSHSGPSQTETVFDDDDVVINTKTGKMFDMKSFLNIEYDFMDKMCDCIISKYAAHDIEMFKAGQSEMLKEKILEFLKED